MTAAPPHPHKRRWFWAGFALMGLAGVAGLSRIISVAIDKVTAGQGLQTYRTVWLVEFNYVGVLVLFAAVLVALLLGGGMWLHDWWQWRSLEKKHGERGSNTGNVGAHVRVDGVTRRQLTVVLLVSAVLVLAGVFVYDRIRYARLLKTAATMYAQAEDFERKGSLQKAHHRYNTLCEGIGIERSDVPKGACDGAHRSHDGVRFAQREVEVALQRHLESRGAYPHTLTELQHDLSKATVVTLDGFLYQRQAADKMTLADGLSFHRFGLTRDER